MDLVFSDRGDGGSEGYPIKVIYGLAGRFAFDDAPGQPKQFPALGDRTKCDDDCSGTFWGASSGVASGHWGVTAGSVSVATGTFTNLHSYVDQGYPAFYADTRRTVLFYDRLMKTQSFAEVLESVEKSGGIALDFDERRGNYVVRTKRT